MDAGAVVRHSAGSVAWAVGGAYGDVHTGGCGGAGLTTAYARNGSIAQKSA